MNRTEVRHWLPNRRPRVFLPELRAGDGAQLMPETTYYMLAPIERGALYAVAAEIGGSVFVDGAHPVLHGPGLRGVYVTEAAQWFGQDRINALPCAIDDRVSRCSALLDYIERALRFEWQDDVSLLASPGVTGRDLWLRTVPDRGYPLVSPDAQDWIRNHSGQARIEMFPARAAVARGLVEYDMRLAYVACTRGLPIGEPIEVGAADLWAELLRARSLAPDPILRRPGRVSIDFVAPAGWSGPGLLPVHDGQRWRWPTIGKHSAVVDTCEMELAVRYGWHIEPTPGAVSLLWHETGDPYRKFIYRCERVLDRAERHWGGLSGGMARNVLRAVMLHTIGAMYGAPHPVSRTGQDVDVPIDAQRLRANTDGSLSWVELQPTRWPSTSHPEWVAHIWARARCRILSGPGKTGLLHLPANIEPVAVRTDAVYLTGDPEWPDDGKAGRFVRKRVVPGPIPWPTTSAQLIAARGTK